MPLQPEGFDVALGQQGLVFRCQFSVSCLLDWTKAKSCGAKLPPFDIITSNITQ